MDKREFGQRLRAIRKRRGYSQRTLAEMMGYKDRSTLAKVENGINDITIETLYRYADVLETDVEELLGIKKSRKIIQNCKVFSFETEKIKVAIREIEKKDYPAVAFIWREVLDVPTTDDDLKKTYEKMRGDGRYSTLIAEVGGEVVGLVTAVFSYAVGHPNGYVKINGLGVRQEYRRKGIGKALLEAAERVAIDSGAPYIALASGFAREEAHAFYEHNGYQKTSYWFRKRLNK
ncbi:MAG: GNAT family N-acetyltransferase [Bacilli bacterium]|nr:GNAT family N-acetyltransferase [Bacilli bacterium]